MPSKCIPIRAIIGVMILTAGFITALLRVNLSISLIAMVHAPPGSDRGIDIPECQRLTANWTAFRRIYALSVQKRVPYDWNARQQGRILGSYFWGFVLTSIPGGFLAERYGPNKLVVYSVIFSAFFTVLIPIAAMWHYTIVIALRLATGLLGGLLLPALQCLIANWAPPVEKGKFMSTLIGGSTLGTVFTWVILGYITETHGWRWGFFVPGIITIVWCIFWVVSVTDHPNNHPCVSDQEKSYISSKVADDIEYIKPVPPYFKIFSSPPFWALILLHFGTLWGIFLLMTGAPKFLAEVLGFSLEQAGYYASFPYLARMCFGFIFGAIGDAIMKRQCCSVTAIRKSFVICSHFIPALLLLSLNFTSCNSVLVITLITLSLGINGSAVITNLQNAHDLAPNYAGTLFGIMSAIGGTSGFITPLLTGLVTQKNNGLKEWHLIFSIAATVYIVTGLIFCIFGTGKQQSWNHVIQKT